MVSIEKGKTIHTLQIVLVEAEQPEDAFQNLYNTFDTISDSHWSDWNEIEYGNAADLNFAGRWKGQVFSTRPIVYETFDDSEFPNYLRYSDDPALADSVIQEYLQYRLNAIEDARSELIKASFDLNTYKYDPHAMDYGMPTYYAGKVIDLLRNKWTPDTSIYDLVEETASLKYFIQRVAKEPTKQFLIPVDFHY